MKKLNLLIRQPIYKLGFIFIISLVFYEAGKEVKSRIIKKNGKEIVICPVKEIRDTIDLPLSSLVKSCELIKLETVEKALFDNAFFTEISENHICIKSYGQQPAKLFDRNGKFLTDIGAIGRGPGEYIQLYGMQIDEKRNLIYLFPFGTCKNILVYDLKGIHQKDIPLVYTQRKFKAFISNESIVTILSMPFKGDSAICFQQTTTGKLLKKIYPSSYMLSRSFDSEIFVNHCTSDFDFYNTEMDTLYHYNTVNNTLEPKFALDFGSDKKPISVCRELPLHYYATLRSNKGRLNIILIDKKTLISNYVHLNNDFFGGIKATPFFSNGFFINNIAAIILKSQIKMALKVNKMSDSMRQKLINIDNSLKPDDNNVILFGKLK